MPRLWGFDVACLGTHGCSGPSFLSRGDVRTAFCHSGAIDPYRCRFEVDGAGNVAIGGQDEATSPAIVFRTGLGNAADAGLAAAGGMPGIDGQGYLLAGNPVRMQPIRFVELPSAVPAGSVVYCTDCREPGQAAGRGTGTMVFRNGSGWRSFAGGAAAN